MCLPLNKQLLTTSIRVQDRSLTEQRSGHCDLLAQYAVTAATSGERSATLFFRSGPLSGVCSVVWSALVFLAWEPRRVREPWAVTHTWPLLTRAAIYGPECSHKHGVKSRQGLEITNGTLNLGIITRHPLVAAYPAHIFTQISHSCCTDPGSKNGLKTKKRV